MRQRWLYATACALLMQVAMADYIALFEREHQGTDEARSTSGRSRKVSRTTTSKHASTKAVKSK